MSAFDKDMVNDKGEGSYDGYINAELHLPLIHMLFQDLMIHIVFITWLSFGCNDLKNMVEKWLILLVFSVCAIENANRSDMYFERSV